VPLHPTRATLRRSGLPIARLPSFIGKDGRPVPLALLVVTAVGVAANVGAFTFRYGEGLSYFSTDPRACANCHIMNDEYASWTKGPHHDAARCVDCHLPHALVPSPRRNPLAIRVLSQRFYRGDQKVSAVA